jgi:Fe-S cluster assembly protein SufD
VDAEQLYYLMTRGLAPREAEALIVAGFFEPLLNKIPDPELEDRGRQLIEERLRG